MIGLRRLHFDGNRFTKVGRAALVDGLELNPHITTLDGGDMEHPSATGSEDQITARTTFYLSRNHFGTHLLLASAPLSLWPHLMQSLDKRVTRCAQQGNGCAEAQRLQRQQTLFSVKHYLIRERIDLLLANLPTGVSNAKKRKFGAVASG